MDDVHKLQRERMARRLFASLAAERLGRASVDAIYEKYKNEPMHESWLQLADIFLQIPIPASGAGEDPVENFKNVVIFRRPQ